jgi:protein O-GlcNAc transferase
MKNKNEIRIAALRRSGQHGIINWIMSQAILGGSIASSDHTLRNNSDKKSDNRDIECVFLNDIFPGANPFLSCTDSNVLDLPPAMQTPKNMLKLWIDRDWLVYNYEDRPLDAVFTDDFERDHNAYVGPSDRRIDIIILRDAFNFFASRLKLAWMSRQMQTHYACTGMAQLWKSYALEFVGNTHLLRHNKTTVNFNRWHNDRDYRCSLAASLGLNFTDAGLKSVIRRYGGGSSFDGSDYHGQADRMPVLQRWKTLANDQRFRQLFSDKELVELSEQIFGRIEGTEVLFSKKTIVPMVGTVNDLPIDHKGVATQGPPASIQEALDLGLQHQKAGRLTEAEAVFRQVLDNDPNHADALNLLGINAALRGENQLAVELIGRAILNDSMVAAYQLNMGNVLSAQGRLQEASSAYLAALKIKPDYAEAHNNLGLVLMARGQIDAAIVACGVALRIKPGFADAHKNLGLALKAQGNLDAALASCRTALKFQPDHAEAYCSLGNILKAQGQIDAAVGAYRSAIELKPDQYVAQDNLLYALHFHPGYDAKTILDEHTRWNQHFAAPLRRLIRPHDNPDSHRDDPERKLRIGYVSPDFRDHVVGRNLLPLLIEHNRECFDITCYANLKIPDSLTPRFRALAGNWRNIAVISDAQAAEMIRNEGIDILVDLALHMADNRLLVFARKPAPVQITFMGYPGTTGLTAMDYRLTDHFLDPPGLHDTYYSEESIRLPDTFWCYDPLSDEPAINELPASKNGYITFGCLNNFCKVNDGVLQLWAMVLNAVPHSRLLIQAPRGWTSEQVLAKLQQQGIASRRIEFVDVQPRLDYLKLYHKIDIGLDTQPYNGHTTSLDAFWMGVPTVTLVGKTAVGRAGWSQLCNLGLQELAAQSSEEYVQKISKLSSNLTRLNQLRSTLRGQMAQSPLMDAKRFARNVESAYRDLWRRWCMTQDG